MVYNSFYMLLNSYDNILFGIFISILMKDMLLASGHAFSIYKNKTHPMS